jgi:hypothetical protein
MDQQWYKSHLQLPRMLSQRPFLGSRLRRLRLRTSRTPVLKANRKGNLITKIFFHISNYNRKPSKTSPFLYFNPHSTPFQPKNLKSNPKRITERREGQNTNINQLNTNAKTRKPPNGPQSIRNTAKIPCKWPPLTKQHM